MYRPTRESDCACEGSSRRGISGTSGAAGDSSPAASPPPPGEPSPEGVDASPAGADASASGAGAGSAPAPGVAASAAGGATASSRATSFAGDLASTSFAPRVAGIAAGAVEPGAASPAPAGAPGPDWPSEGMCSLMLLRPGRVARASEHPKKVRGGLEPAAATVDALQTSARHMDRRGQSVATRSGKDADCDLVRIF